MMFIQLIKERYKYRHLIWVLAWVEFKERYKNSALGYFWSLLEPLIMLGVLYIIFSNLMKVQVEYYQLFLLQGIIMWNFFSRATSIGLMSIIGKPGLIKKVYFPRDILVISVCITTLLMGIFESVIFIGFMLFFRIPLSIYIIFLPAIIFIFFLIALGTTLALASLNVYYRDIRYIWAPVLQIGFFATPVVYPLTVFPPVLQKILSLNPIAQVLYLARDVTLYSNPPNPAVFLYTIVISIIVLCTGYVIFSRLEPKFAEEL